MEGGGCTDGRGNSAERDEASGENIRTGITVDHRGDIVTKGLAKIFIWRASDSGTAGGHLAEPSESLSSTIVPQIQGWQEHQTQALQETGGCTAGDMRPTRSIWQSACEELGPPP